VKPRFQEPEDPDIGALLDNLDTRVALTLQSWSERRCCPVPRELNEEEALNLLAWSCNDNMAEWLRGSQ